jgi:hypothetical protein
MPLFEPYRHLDPTTREHDEKKGREPRYWRDMDRENYEAFKRENRRKLLKHQWA